MAEEEEVAEEVKKNQSSSTLADNTDDKLIPPTKKYLPKPRKIVIPFVIPWENRSAVQTQKGMGAFGASRNAVTSISGGKPAAAKGGELNSDTILSIFAEGNKFASQTGMRSFGAHRQQISSSTSSRQLDKSKIQPSEGIIPKQAGNFHCPTQSGETPIGALRSQVPKIKFQDGMSKTTDKSSDSFVSKVMAPNPNNKAGTGVIDTKRQVVVPVVGGSKHDPQTEGIVPKLLDRSDLDSPSTLGVQAGYFGLGLGRQVVTPVQDTVMSTLTDVDVHRSKNMVPWSNAACLSSQAKTGGFQHTRDVVNVSNYTKSD